MFSGFSGLDGPWDVELIRKWIVNGVDVGVGEEFFVRAVCLGNCQGGRCFLRLREIAGRDGHDTCVFALLHCWENFLETDIGGAEDSPAKLLVHDGNDNSWGGDRPSGAKALAAFQRRLCTGSSPYPSLQCAFPQA